MRGCLGEAAEEHVAEVGKGALGRAEEGGVGGGEGGVARGRVAWEGGWGGRPRRSVALGGVMG